MPKVKLHAGAEIDVLNKHELHQTLQAWMVEAVKGIRPRRLAAVATIASNAFTMGGEQDSNINNILGPEAGYLWMVRRIAITGPTLASDVTNVYIGRQDPQNLVYPALTGLSSSTGYKSFSRDELVVNGGESLVIASTGSVAATGTVTVTLGVTEIPVGLLWKIV